MVDVHHITEKEVFQASYITVRGWEYVEWERKWFKHGFTRETFKLRVCGCCRDELETKWFHLEDAYDAQREQDDAKHIDQGTKEVYYHGEGEG